MQLQKLTTYQACWQATLQEYSLQFIHITGTKNSAANTLSHHSDFNAKPTTVSTLLPKAIWLEGGGVRPPVVSLFKIDWTVPKAPKASAPVWKVSFKELETSEHPPEEKSKAQKGKGCVFQLNANLYQEEKREEEIHPQCHTPKVFGEVDMDTADEWR
ncbi:hypothetical protein M404DRAFT_28262 [Pisolithus tinctorius Marx 270]|uniref:Uncharacterized protein n=1 Tax=Pisolithus tinctorius Marx 270 TaxID=870435 RepID=A0A0C3NM80_PISTI|nr:hypothetical protein M404DRAFT_28262 [Pisolithus tinctorius Marx 270]